MFVLNIVYIRMYVVMLNIDDVGLIYSMKWLMLLVFYLCGFFRNLGFILFYGSSICDVL